MKTDNEIISECGDDASKWAKAFMTMFNLIYHPRIDEATMRGWFANAIESRSRQTRPVDMIIFCFRCGVQHVDEAHGKWKNPPHKTHECHSCGFRFRVADVPTNGVRELETIGQNDHANPVRASLSITRMSAVRYYERDPITGEYAGPPVKR